MRVSITHTVFNNSSRKCSIKISMEDAVHGIATEGVASNPDVLVAALGKRKRRKLARIEEIKEKNREAKRAKKHSSGPPPPVKEISQDLMDERTARKQSKREAFGALCAQSFDVVVDCDWESEHSEKDLNSLFQQITFCYSTSKKSSNPCHIHLTGVGVRLRSQLSKVDYYNWMGVSVHDADYISVNISKTLVYLTADGESTLETLDSNCAYIIGGIVDRNRLKGATFNKASQQGIRTAKLPIKEYCDIKSTPVLTVNHVLEILLSFSRCGSWADAFQCILPQRKAVSAKAEASVKSDIPMNASIKEELKDIEVS